MTFAFDVRRFEASPQQTTQSHGKHRPLQRKDYKTAFYGPLSDGSPAFGDRHALPENHPSPTLSTVPNSPAVGDQPSAVRDGAVSGPCQTSADGGKPYVHCEQGIQLGGLKRRWSPEDASGESVKRQRSSNPENPAHKAGPRDAGDQPNRLAGRPLEPTESEE